MNTSIQNIIKKQFLSFDFDSQNNKYIQKKIPDSIFSDKEIEELKNFNDDNFYKEIQKYKPILKKYKTLLDPLKELKLYVDISIVGGAIRDTICQKDIKDLDILISLNTMYNLPHLTENKLYNFYGIDIRMNKNKYFILNESLPDEFKNFINIDNKNIYTTLTDKNFVEFFYLCENYNKLKELNIIDELTIFSIKNKTQNIITLNDVKFQLIKNLLKNEKIKQDINFSSSKDGYEGVCGLIKIDDKDNYNIEFDLLISEHNPETYIQLFDYNICKIFAEYKKDKLTIQYNELFLKDYLNKTLTFNLDIYNNENKDSENKDFMKNLKGHTKRILKKFNDWTVIFNNPININNNPNQKHSEEIFNYRQNLIKIYKSQVLKENILEKLVIKNLQSNKI